MRSFFVLAALTSSALAYEVTRPSLNQGWTNQGAQTIAWERVSSDSTSFAVVLTNLNRQILSSDILLAESVDGTSATTLTISPPSGGWPIAGGSYRVNLVRSDNELNSILAQSSEFNITASTVSPASASNGASRLSSTRSVASTATGENARSAATSSGDAGDAASTDSGLISNNKSSGVRTTAVGPVILTGLMVLVGTMLL